MKIEFMYKGLKIILREGESNNYFEVEGVITIEIHKHNVYNESINALKNVNKTLLEKQLDCIKNELKNINNATELNDLNEMARVIKDILNHY